MSQGIIRSEGRGFWFVEEHESRRCFFVHHSQVITDIYLHIGDTIEFSVIPNPIRSGQQMAGSVKLIDRVMKSKSTAVDRA